MEPAFFLQKWYLDVTDAHGNAAIAYSGSLRWRGVTISYTSLLHFDPEKGASLRTRLLHPQPPVLEPGRLVWQDDAFGASGEWATPDQPLQATVHDDGKGGSLQWKCHLPRARAGMKLQVHPPITGWGYAEHLSMTTEPWHIPMDVLRWGRFCSATRSLVWIDIRAEHPRQWVFLNGERIEGAHIGDDRIAIPSRNIEIAFDQSGNLETERKILQVATSLLAYIPGIGRLIPPTFLHAREQKWRSRARWLESGQLVENDWAIHERVDFTPEKQDR